MIAHHEYQIKSVLQKLAFLDIPTAVINKGEK